MSNDFYKKFVLSKHLEDVSRFVRSAFGWTGNPEQEQAAIRILIPASVYIYLLTNKPSSTEGLLLWSSGIKFVSVFMSISLLIYLSTIVVPTPSLTRKVVSILVDTAGQSLALHLTGPIGAPWYGIYLWVILGNGFRYGEKYLYLATASSIIGFTYVSVTTPYWWDHIGLAVGLAFTLLLIPAYSAILIRRLNEARQRADAASRAKSDFLSCMSHEIRTPLNGILGMTDLLRLRPLPEEDKDCVETIHISGHALARQINEILDLSKIEAGRMTVETVDFDLHVLINTTLRIFQSQANDKGLKLVSILDPSVPYLLSGDPHKIRQIITNLVGNALKFTAQGSITVHISCLDRSDNSARLRFEITDTGTGIPEDRLQAIFEPFTQASNSVSRKYGGTGLGTTICKNLVELMGGTIGIQSTVNIGSTFWFELPFAFDRSKLLTGLEQWTSQCKVVILHGNQHACVPLIDILDEWEIHRDVFNEADAAIMAVTNANTYDALIVCEVDSYTDLIAKIPGAQKVLGERIPTVCITAESTTDVQNGSDNGVIFIKNPLENDQLLNILHAGYTRHGKEDAIVKPGHTRHTKQIIQRKLNILVSDDNATNRIVMQRMLDKLGHSHTIVDGGEAALLALEDDSYDAVIIDKNMPDMGGLEVYQAYCFAHGGSAPVEFAILTADATEEARASCMTAGIRYFLTKPVSLDRLTDTLTDMCGPDADDNAARNDKSAPPPTSSESCEIFNQAEFAKLEELSGGDPAFITEIVANFISDSNDNIRNLEVAVARGNWLEFRDLAHALKGSSLYLGLTHLALLAKEAQDITQDDFRNRGASRVQEIRKAADHAFRLISERVMNSENKRVAGRRTLSGGS